MPGSLTAKSAQGLSPWPETTSSEVKCDVQRVSSNACSLNGASQGKWHYYGAEIALALGRSSAASGQDLQEERLVFRSYQLVPGARMLLLDGKPVKLGSRAFDLLHVLLSSRGRIVSKEEIVKHVWPDTTVEESNLRFQMGCLRRALGRDRDLIKTIPGRGYILATEVPALGPAFHAKSMGIAR